MVAHEALCFQRLQRDGSELCIANIVFYFIDVGVLKFNRKMAVLYVYNVRLGTCIVISLRFPDVARGKLPVMRTE